jgi:hypothetical protein
MTSAAAALDLGGELDWATTMIPGGTGPVDIVRLWADPVRRSSIAYVRFPAGWERRSDGRYDVDEELIVVSGELHLTGTVYGAGEYGWVPGGALRRATATPTGCLALAYFSGVPNWMDGEEDVPWQPRHHEVLATASAGGLRTSPTGSCKLVDGLEATTAEVPCDVITVGHKNADWSWQLVSAGATLPLVSQRCLVREHR